MLRQKAFWTEELDTNPYKSNIKLISIKIKKKIFKEFILVNLRQKAFWTEELLIRQESIPWRLAS